MEISQAGRTEPAAYTEIELEMESTCYELWLRWTIVSDYIKDPFDDVHSAYSSYEKQCQTSVSYNTVLRLSLNVTDN